MALPWKELPPNERTAYVISQLEGERITIPGSKGVFRILASSKQTGGAIAVFQSASVLSDAPGFHYHNQAHDVFLVTKGFLKLWNGDKCRIMGPGDFAYIPPKIIHNPEMLGPHTEIMGLVAPGDWIDFFRYIGETFTGLIAPEFDNRNIKEHIIGKMMKADRDYDVNFVRDYTPPEVAEFDESDSKIPEGSAPYYLRANTGPRWMAGDVLSRPFCTTAQTTGKFAMTSLESSKDYGESILSRYMTFPHVDHCLAVMEGKLVVKMKAGQEYTISEGETAVIPANQGFALGFASKYVRVWTFSSGDGVEAIIHKAGAPFEGFILPDRVQAYDRSKLDGVCQGMGVSLD